MIKNDYHLHKLIRWLRYCILTSFLFFIKSLMTELWHTLCPYSLVSASILVSYYHSFFYTFKGMLNDKLKLEIFIHRLVLHVKLHKMNFKTAIFKLNRMEIILFCRQLTNVSKLDSNYVFKEKGVFFFY
jgi:hypothetical protein